MTSPTSIPAAGARPDAEARAAADARTGPMPWRALGGPLTIVAMISTLIAALLTVFAPAIGGFWRNLLFSQCIGLAITAWALGLRRVPPLRRLAPPLATLVATLGAAPLGTFSGYALAYTLLGEPVRLLSTGHGRMIALLATVIGSGLVGYLLWIRQRLALEAAGRAQAQQLATEAELRLLRAQIEPHMLFNTLANLRSLVDDDPALAKTMLDQLIVYLRAALAASRSEWTTLQQEFTQLRAYLDIMAVRLGPRLRFELQLPDALRATPIPPMLLQPLVENALKHGIEPKIGGGAVQVSAALDAAGAVEVVVADTGLGLGAPGADGGSRYGLEHVRERLRSVYGARAALEIAPNLPQGTRATVRLPA